MAWGTLHGVALALNKWWHETFSTDARRAASREAGAAVRTLLEGRLSLMDGFLASHGLRAAGLGRI